MAALFLLPLLAYDLINLRIPFIEKLQGSSAQSRSSCLCSFVLLFLSLIGLGVHVDEMELRLLEITTPTGKPEDIGLGYRKVTLPTQLRCGINLCWNCLAKPLCFCPLPSSAEHYMWKSMSVDQFPF